MKKIFDEEDEKDFQENDKAKILVTIIPFVLIILVLLVTLRIVIELKKDANAQIILNRLYKHTQMQESRKWNRSRKIRIRK